MNHRGKIRRLTSLKTVGIIVSERCLSVMSASEGSKTSRVFKNGFSLPQRTLPFYQRTLNSNLSSFFFKLYAVITSRKLDFKYSLKYSSPLNCGSEIQIR